MIKSSMKTKTITYFFVIISLFFTNSSIANSKKTPNLDELRAKRFYDNLFKDNLLRGYLEYSDSLWAAGNKEKAVYYGRKASAISTNLDPEMENLYNREIDIQPLNDLLGAKYFLEAAQVQGLKNIAPDVAAKAQVNFDCWVETADNNSKNIPQNSCKADFEGERIVVADILDSMKLNEMENRRILKEQLAREAEIEAAKKFERKLATQEQQLSKLPEYSLIFFRYNDTKLGVTGKGILDKVAKDIEIFRPGKVVISGHADKTGSYNYNMQLAMKRGQAMANYLVEQHGISPSLLDVKAYGENDPRVYKNKIKKDVRNRYVRVIFLKDNRIYYPNSQ